ncbi:MAG: DUF2249 domain-containing protein [Halobacteriales archaeon]
MPTETLDVRDLPPAERHSRIRDAFAGLESGESLQLINDHDPKPLYYELEAEVDSFDAVNYELEQRDENEFVAILPKE